MKANYQTSTGKRLFILILFYCKSGFKYLFEGTHKPAINEVKNANLISPHNVSESKNFFIKKTLCH
jgi:hypothetical protein